jgi:Domain of unknown function (DUF4249)
MRNQFQKIGLVLIISLIFIGSCIEPLEIDLDEELKVLIVEGAITTQPGPHLIRLSRSARYGNILFNPILPVNGATVIIRDSDGNNYSLTEQQFSLWHPEDGHWHDFMTGLYATPIDFLPEVGKSYTLLITTTDGTKYTSLPETILRASEILELTAEFKSIPREDDMSLTGIDVYATFQDDPESQNFYLWKNNGTYQINTFPEKFVPFTIGPPPPPAPKDCCRTCWINELSADRSLQLLADRNVNGNLITDKVAFIEVDGNRFDDKYLVRIEQHTLSREAFQFFSLLQNQISISGDIFDPPPATIRGNMINLTSPDENVIGYFRASDVSIDSMFLTQDMLLEPGTLNSINDDCRVYQNGSTIRPDYW